MRILYTFLYVIFLPILSLIHYRRAKKTLHWRELFWTRWGVYTEKPVTQGIWLHAASMGEALGLEPLIQQLLLAYPNKTFVVTSFTDAGLAYQQKRWAGETRIQVYYLPYDLPFLTRRFFSMLKPVLGVIMETELWPNLLCAAQRASVPLVMVNARLSDRSFKHYAYFPSLMRRVLSYVTVLVCRTAEDLARFEALGAQKNRLVLGGDIKYNRSLSAEVKAEAAALRKAYGDDRFIWVCVSTHPGEDDIIFSAFEEWHRAHPNTLLVIAPRHPKRFDGVAALCDQHKLSYVRRTEKTIPTKDTSVVIGDTMGEALMFLGLSDIAFVGGSLVTVGGHNLLEPARWGVPIITGQHLNNVKETRDGLLALSVEDYSPLMQATDACSLLRILQVLYADQNLRLCLGKLARDFAERPSDALTTCLEIVDQQLS